MVLTEPALNLIRRKSYEACKERADRRNGDALQVQTLDYFLESQQELGVQSIEFWCARPHFLLDDYGFEDVKKAEGKAGFLRNEAGCIFPGVYGVQL